MISRSLIKQKHWRLSRLGTSGCRSDKKIVGNSLGSIALFLPASNYSDTSGLLLPIYRKIDERNNKIPL
jgi:hypothetical protein